MRQLLDRHVQFVAHIAPQSTQHLVVEFTRLIVGHEFRGFLQTFGGYLVGLTRTTLGDVGILDSPLTEDDEQRDKHNEHDDQ